MSNCVKNKLPRTWKLPTEAGGPLTDEQIALILSPDRNFSHEEFKRLYSCSWDVAKPDKDASVIPDGALVTLKSGNTTPFRVVKRYEHKGRTRYRVVNIKTGSERGVNQREICAVLSKKEAQELSDKAKKTINIQQFI
ncbi:hypothetical protein [Acinetobacter chengduensis]|uniref:Uncharacterized protein n=1 Tax=Acinetobacter chengduensis TaxID=2420890 RepID=A0ABX9TSL0_9GAMM|nr:hypothetical protein [Acinetobacter chengduensis]RLL19008.1 hypothetical protein D9K81_14730 [Acinetobacter chengduensis]